MAVRPSLLTHRIRRLVDEPHHAHPVRAGAAWALALLLPIAVLALAPGLADNARAEPSTPSVVPTIDADLTALQHELTEVHDLLLDAGHDDLARRLEERLRALRSKRATLAPPLAVEGR